MRYRLKENIQAMDLDPDNGEYKDLGLELGRRLGRGYIYLLAHAVYPRSFSVCDCHFQSADREREDLRRGLQR